MPGRQAARRGRQTKRASATTHASAKKMDTSPVRSKRGSSSPSPKKKKKKGELEVDTSALDFQASPVRSKRGSPKRKRKRTKDQKEQNASALEFEVSSSAHSSSSSSSSEEDEESKPSPPKKQKRKHQAGKHKKLPPKPETPQHESDHEQMASIDYSSDQFLEGLPDPDGRADDSFAADVSGIFSPVLTERGSPATARKEQNLTHSHKATRRSTRKKAHALEDSDDDDEDISTGAVAFEFEDESEEEPLGKSLGDDSRSTVGARSDSSGGSSSSSSGGEADGPSPNTLVFNELNANMAAVKPKRRPARQKHVKMVDQSLDDAEKAHFDELASRFKSIDEAPMESFFEIV